MSAANSGLFLLSHPRSGSWNNPAFSFFGSEFRAFFCFAPDLHDKCSDCYGHLNVTFFCFSKRKSPKKRSPEKTTAPVFRHLRGAISRSKKQGAVRAFSGLPARRRIQHSAISI